MTVITAALVAIAVALSGFLAILGGTHAQVVRAQGTAELAAIAAATAALADRFTPCDVAGRVAGDAGLSLTQCSVDSLGFAVVGVRSDRMNKVVEARAGPFQYE